jgi:hypothetical protein
MQNRLKRSVRMPISVYEDELKLCKALGDLDTAELQAHTAAVIEKYQAEIDADLIDSGRVATRSCENIWLEILAGKR